MISGLCVCTKQTLKIIIYLYLTICGFLQTILYNLFNYMMCACILFNLFSENYLTLVIISKCSYQQLHALKQKADFYIRVFFFKYMSHAVFLTQISFSLLNQFLLLIYISSIYCYILMLVKYNITMAWCYLLDLQCSSYKIILLQLYLSLICCNIRIIPKHQVLSCNH